MTRWLGLVTLVGLCLSLAGCGDVAGPSATIARKPRFGVPVFVQGVTAEPSSDAPAAGSQPTP